MEGTTKGFEFLPAQTSNNSIEIFAPFAKLACEYFSKKNISTTCNEIGSTIISFEKMDLGKKEEILKDIKVFLKESRQVVIDNFLIYKDRKISYL